MYLWKYWRETRIAFGIGLTGIAIMFVLIQKEPTVSISGNMPFEQFARLLPLPLFMQAIPLAFFAWFFGSIGVGRDMGDGIGAFIFSKPRNRPFFIWRDWGFGLTQLLVMTVLINVVIGLQFHRAIVSAGDPLHGSLPLASGPVSLLFLIGLVCFVAFLFAALIFSLTYFCTVLMKHSRGAMLAAGVLLGYLILKTLVSHYWPDVELPALIGMNFFGPSLRLPAFANHLGILLALRAAVVLLFPFAAQLVLEKTDI